MAKVSFTKLGLKKNEDVEIVEWNEQKIEVKQYLPIEEKLDLVTKIINDSIDTNNFYNPAKIYIFTILNTILYYTNINLTDKQKEDVAKTYDLLVSSGLSVKIFEQINPYEYNQIKSWVLETVQSIYSYAQSVLGILETVNNDYKDADFNAEQIQNKLTNNPEELKLLKDILDRLG